MCKGAVNFAIVAALAVSLVLLAACTGGRSIPAYTVLINGAAYRGQQLIVDKNCGSCHTIPGIHGARGLVGPPLYFFSRRTMIAGEVPNTPDNLVRWVMTPQAIEPNTAMPNLGLSNEQARDVAAYLYTLR